MQTDKHKESSDEENGNSHCGGNDGAQENVTRRIINSHGSSADFQQNTLGENNDDGNDIEADCLRGVGEDVLNANINPDGDSAASPTGTDSCVAEDQQTSSVESSDQGILQAKEETKWVVTISRHPYQDPNNNFDFEIEDDDGVLTLQLEKKEDNAPDNTICSFTVPLGSTGGDPALDQLLFAEVSLAEEGSVKSCRTMAKAQVVLEDQPTCQRQAWTERIPVATPIFDAEVQVWDYQRPKYRRHFGYGLFGRNPERQVRQPRDPVFTEEDLSNPFRCLCKAVGIAAGLPLYFVYCLCCKMDIWCPIVAGAMDCLLLRTTGCLLDGIFCAISCVIWALYMYMAVPIYTIIVYALRVVWYVLLYLVKYGLVWPLETVCFYGILPCAVWFQKSIILPIVTGVSVLCESIRDACMSLWALMVECKIWLHNKLLIPWLVGTRDMMLTLKDFTCRCFVSTCNHTYTLFVLPVGNCLRVCYSNIILPIGTVFRCCFMTIWSGASTIYNWIYATIYICWAEMCKATQRVGQYICASIASCSTAIHSHLLEPIGKGISLLCTLINNTIIGAFTATLEAVRIVFYVVLWQHMLQPACNGVVSGVRFVFYVVLWKHILQPMYTGIFSGVRFIFHVVLRKYILQPLCNGIVSGVRFIFYVVLWQSVVLAAYNGFISGAQWSFRNIWIPLRNCIVGFLLRPFGNLIKFIWRGIVSFGRAIGNILVFVWTGVVSVWQAIRNSLISMGNAILGTFQTIGQVVANTAVGIFQSIEQVIMNILRSTEQATAALWATIANIF